MENKRYFSKNRFLKRRKKPSYTKSRFFTSKLEQNGITVIDSFISPYQETRDLIRNLCSNSFEVHVATPLEVLEKRVTKSLYKKTRNGEIKQFTGLDDPYEIPQNHDITIDTSNITITDTIDNILNIIDRCK